eukprot:COSAG06_NODE_16758_length_982_cov_2.761042_1_plen_45_part_00
MLAAVSGVLVLVDQRERRAREIREIGTVDERVMDIEVAEGTIKE